MPTEPEQPDIEPQEPTGDQPPLVTKGTSGRKSFSKARREMTEEELSSPAAQKLLLDEVERLEADCIEYSGFRTKFHEIDKRAAILDERFKTKVSIEIIHVACITVGAAALGYAPSIWSNQPTAWLVAIFGTVLVIAAIVAKAVKP